MNSMKANCNQKHWSKARHVFLSGEILDNLVLFAQFVVLLMFLISYSFQCKCIELFLV
jgi:hypothetical protein